MDKKSLIVGSICAVVLLVLGSLSNAVGYQSMKSSTISDSPLFSIRTSKATNNENNKVITSVYLGKGINSLSFPQRDNRTVMIQKFIDRIKTMDDATFNNFISMIIRLIQKEPKFHNVNTQELLAVLYQVKNNKNILSNNDMDFNHKIFGASDTSNTICDLLNLILVILVVFYLYLRVVIMSILQPGNCYESLWATCLLISK